MSYLGNSPELNTFTVGVEKFNGSGACTQFTLTRDIDDPNYIEVVVGGVQQTPIDAYSVTNGVITFTTPPGLGTNNVVVIYRTGTTIAYNQISASQILANSITSIGLAPNAVTNSKIAPNAITGDKLADDIITSNNLVDQSITGNLIGLGAITGNNFAEPITGNLIGAYAISGNQIGVGAITGNNFAQPITGNMIGTYAISGNQIGLGAISSNHFAGGGVTSDVLSSNLTISTSRVAETINVVTTAVGGNYEIHIANSTVYHLLANTSANVTFQLIANTGRSVDTMLGIGQSAAVAIMMKQGSTRYRANLHIDGVLQTAYWAGNAQPQYVSSGGAQPMSYDAYTFSIMKIGAGQYTVFASNTNFGQANGQGMSAINNGFGPEQ